jgi:excisionase family DNA binding protein
MYADDNHHLGLSEPLLNATQAARLLAVRPAWIYAAVREGRLPHVRLGRQVRFLRADLEQFVGNHHADARILHR